MLDAAEVVVGVCGEGGVVYEEGMWRVGERGGEEVGVEGGLASTQV